MARPEEYSDRGLPPAVDSLLRLSAALTQRLNQHLHDACGLSLAQYQFLCVAAGGRVALGELAAALGCTRGNVTGLADRLAEQGLVQRLHDPDDRRVTYIELTEAGRSRLAAARRAVEQALRPLRGEGELAALASALAEGAAAVVPARVARAPGRRYAEGRARPVQRLQERPAPVDHVAPQPEPAVRVTGEKRQVVVVRDDQVVRLVPARPLAE